MPGTLGRPPSIPAPSTPLTPALTRLRLKLESSESTAGPSAAMLVTDPINVAYLTGFTGDSTWLLIAGDGPPVVLSDQRYQTQLARQCADLDREIRTPDVSMVQLLARCVTERLADEPAIRFEADHVSVAVMEGWIDAMPTVRWLGKVGVVESLRNIKTDAELAKIRRAIEVAERAFRSVTARLTDVMTERQVAHDLESVMRQLGATGASFPPIVGVDAGAALPHYQPTDRPLSGGRVLLIDWGANVDGYTSDLTRTLHRFGPTDDVMRDRFVAAYEATYAAAAAGLAKIGVGVAAADVDAAARSVIAGAGLGEAFKHGLGHGFGRQVHESPRLGATSKETLAAGMVVTIEPGVYFEDDFGIRIEDDVLVTDRGGERLSTLPSGLEACRWVV